ncbi:iron chelate uptake ABC transporter family permease subunit [Thalassospira sp. UBA1131]
MGAALMVAADWLGRMLFFPWEIPAGLMAAIIAGPIMVWLLMRVGRGAS